MMIAKTLAVIKSSLSSNLDILLFNELCSATSIIELNITDNSFRDWQGPLMHGITKLNSRLGLNLWLLEIETL